MLDNPCCPACSCFAWQELGSRTYRLADSLGASRYVQQRLRILFQIWLPGQSAIKITSILCKRCGLVTYRPRPDARDLAAKYTESDAVQDSGAVQGQGDGREAMARRRGAEMLRAIHRLSGRQIRGFNVLDYGGGDGSMMAPFVAAGCHCDLIDYTPTHAQGVRKIGDTLAALPVDQKYDLVVASHVVEHLVDPLQVCKDLARHLAADGLMYVEVPMEIWGNPPLQSEPVTHLNFFTRSSLIFLLQAAGLEVIGCQLASSLHPTGQRYAAVKALARREKAPVVPPMPGSAEAELFVSGRLNHRIVCALRCPRVLVSALRRRLFR